MPSPRATMLLKHTAYYFLARGFPAFVNFLALSIYSHLLTPGEYGQYALVVAAISLANSVLFWWIQLAIRRYLPREVGQGEVLLSTLVSAYLLLVGVTGLFGCAIYVTIDLQPWRGFIPIALVALWVQAWHEITLQLVSSRLRPLRYGLISIVRSLFALGISVLLLRADLAAQALLWGLVLGALLSTLALARAEWHGVQLRLVNRRRLRESLRYGLPLSAVFIFEFVVSTSDRFVLAWLIDDKATGLYSAGYDLAKYSLGALMAMVYLAANPLVVRTFEKEGATAAKALLERYGLLLLAVSAPTTVGIAILANNISIVVLGDAFSSSAGRLMPWIAVAALLVGAKTFYYDLAFQLGERTIGQVGVMVAAAVLNFLLNIAWIPSYGIQGAAWAAVAAYSIATILSMWFGRIHFPIPQIPRGSTRVIAATAVMAVCLLPVHGMRGLTALFVQVLLGAAVYGIAVLLLNVGNVQIALLTLAHNPRRISGRK